MNLQNVNRVYLGNTPIRFNYIGSQESLDSLKEFIFFDPNAQPTELSAINTSAGDVNKTSYVLSRFTDFNNSQISYIWKQSGPVRTANTISYSFTNNRWEVFVFGLTSTNPAYINTNSQSPFVVPLTGWEVTNSNFLPAPIFQPVPYKILSIASNQPPYTFIPPFNQTDFKYKENILYCSKWSNNLENLLALNLGGAAVSSVDFSVIPNVKDLSINSEKFTNFTIQNNPTIEKITYKTLAQPNIIQITNNSNLKDLKIGGDYVLTKGFITLSSFNITNNPNLSSLYLQSDELNELTVNYPKLNKLILICPNLSSLNVVSISPTASYIDISQTSLSGFQAIDSFYNSLCTLVNSNSSAWFTFLYVNDPSLGLFSDQYSIFTTKNNTTILGRSSASNDAFFSILRNVNLANFERRGIFNKNQLEIDPSYPKNQSPFINNQNSTLPDVFNTRVLITSPVSGNTRYTTLTGLFRPIVSPRVTYLNFRPMYVNSSSGTFTGTSAYILYNIDNNTWNVIPSAAFIPPNSADWTQAVLSADAGVGDAGNLPSFGWTGIGYTGGNFLQAGSPWYNETTVFHTSLLMFSALEIDSGFRYVAKPLSGFNNNFYWKNIDFSGIGFANLNDVGDPRAYLISPIHIIFNMHYPPGGTINFLHRDGSITTRSIIGTQVVPPFEYDRAIGILNAPVSAVPFRLGVNNFFKTLTAADVFNRFLTGPDQMGKFGIHQPIYYVPYRAVHKPAYGPNIYSVPKSLWKGNSSFIGKDSTTGFWYLNGNEPILLGSAKGFNPDAGPYFTHDNVTGAVQTSTITQIMTALSLQYFGPDTHYYTLSVYNFEA